MLPTVKAPWIALIRANPDTFARISHRDPVKDAPVTVRRFVAHLEARIAALEAHVSELTDRAAALEARVAELEGRC